MIKTQNQTKKAFEQSLIETKTEDQQNLVLQLGVLALAGACLSTVSPATTALAAALVGGVSAASGYTDHYNTYLSILVLETAQAAIHCRGDASPLIGAAAADLGAISMTAVVELGGLAAKEVCSYFVDVQ